MSTVQHILGCNIKHLLNTKESEWLKGTDNIIHRYDGVWFIPTDIDNNKQYAVIELLEIEPSSLNLQFYNPDYKPGDMIQVMMEYRLKPYL